RREHVDPGGLVLLLAEDPHQALAEMAGASGDENPHAAHVRRARSASLSVSSQKAASIAVSVISRRSWSDRPIRSAHTRYSPAIVAPKYGGSSEPSVTFTPSARSSGSGCSSNEG